MAIRNSVLAKSVFLFSFALALSHAAFAGDGRDSGGNGDGAPECRNGSDCDYIPSADLVALQARPHGDNDPNQGRDSGGNCSQRDCPDDYTAIELVNE